MSSSDIAVSVRGLSKSYTIVHDQEKHNTLAETMLSRLKNPLNRPKKETFWALKDVSFDIKKGEVVGIIGRNGAGKSTLLKILSRITEPTRGQIDLYGRVGSLLEVGTGFHPELTGRENIFLNGAILGMSKAEIRKQFDAIVDFAGVEKFLDTPVKRYSSGMYVRLAFAVAAHLNPEILVVDEVLAVGDAEFQKKCLGKMKDVAAGGRTVVFVSHNMAAIEGLCTAGLLLSGGHLVNKGVISHVVAEYVKLVQKCASGSRVMAFRSRDGCRLEIERIGYIKAGDEEDLELDLKMDLPLQVQRFGVGLHVFAPDGYKVARLWPAYCLPEFGVRKGSLRVRLIINSVSRYLASGSYRVDITLHDTHTSTLLQVEDAFELVVAERDVMETGYPFRFPDSGIVPLRVSGHVLADVATTV